LYFYGQRRKKVTDRRIRKTRTNVFNALSSLLLSRESPDSISVTELCEKADISKSTFYLHFMDIYDCREQWADEYVESLIDAAGGLLYEDILKDPKKFSLGLVLAADSSREICRRLSPENCEPKNAINIKKRLIDKVIEKNGFEPGVNLSEILNLTLLIGGIFDFYAYSPVTASKQRIAEEVEKKIKAVISPASAETPEK